MNDFAEMGCRLRFVRAQMNMNQADFANYVGVSPQSLSMWEKGRRELTLAAARKIRDKTPYGLDFLDNGDTRAFNAAQTKAWNDWLDSDASA